MTYGTLYLIPNSLGKASDLSSILPEEVKRQTAKLTYFIAENAKTARAHLKEVAQTHPLLIPMQQIHIAELNVNTKDETLSELLTPLLNGHDVGLISEAGLPAIADPGANLVEKAHATGIVIKPLVGPSSILLALIASGLNGQNFAFNGYLPTQKEERKKAILEKEALSKKLKQTQLFIETPYRNLALLEAFCETCQPLTKLCIATDLTLESESIQTKTIRTWKEKILKKQVDFIQKRPSIFLFLAD